MPSTSSPSGRSPDLKPRCARALRPSPRICAPRRTTCVRRPHASRSRGCSRPRPSPARARVSCAHCRNIPSLPASPDWSSPWSGRRRRWSSMPFFLRTNWRHGPRAILPAAVCASKRCCSSVIFSMSGWTRCMPSGRNSSNARAGS